MFRAEVDAKAWLYDLPEEIIGHEGTLVLVPSLARGDGIDDTTVSFLVQAALQQEEEEQEKALRFVLYGWTENVDILLRAFQQSLFGVA